MLLLTVLSACSDYALKGGDTAADPPEPGGTPDIVVTPLLVDFGFVDPDVGADPQLVTIENVGTGDLLLTAVEVSSGSPFTLEAMGPGTVPGGASVVYRVRFEAPGSDAADLMAIHSEDPDEPLVNVELRAAAEPEGPGPAPDITIDPVTYDFGTLEYAGRAAMGVTVRNDGDADLTITGVSYTTASAGELVMQDPGAFPIVLSPGMSTLYTVEYTPVDGNADTGYVTVQSDDVDEPSVTATQSGNSSPFEGFSTGWYIVEDDTAFPVGTDAGYPITSHGDPNTYWYEPSGMHGMIATTDVVGDFTTLHDYVVGRAGAPTAITGPLNFRATSTIPCQAYASFNYILADFWIDPADDPNLYELTSGAVDDGIEVIVNGQIVGFELLDAGFGAWSLGAYLTPGAVNTLVVILADDCASDKYVNELTFVREGVIVTG